MQSADEMETFWELVNIISAASNHVVICGLNMTCLATRCPLDATRCPVDAQWMPTANLYRCWNMAIGFTTAGGPRVMVGHIEQFASEQVSDQVTEPRYSR